MSMRGEAGYMHVKDAWSTILRKQVITHIVDGTQVVLQAEIVVETGCMLSFAISRVLVKDIRALRSLTLLPCERYVKILDLSRLWNRRTQSFCGERRYVTISYKRLRELLPLPQLACADLQNVREFAQLHA